MTSSETPLAHIPLPNLPFPTASPIVFLPTMRKGSRFGDGIASRAKAWGLSQNVDCIIFLVYWTADLWIQQWTIDEDSLAIWRCGRNAGIGIWQSLFDRCGLEVRLWKRCTNPRLVGSWGSITWADLRIGAHSFQPIRFQLTSLSLYMKLTASS